MEPFGHNNNFDLSFFLTLSKVTNEIGVSHSQRYSNSLWLCFYAKRETNYSLKHSIASTRSLGKKGAQLWQSFSQSFSQRLLHCGAQNEDGRPG